MEDAFSLSIMISIFPLKRVTKEALTDINNLLPQLSAQAKLFSFEELQGMIKQKHLLILVAKEENRTVGMGQLVLLRKSLGFCAMIEDVIVDEKWRGKGIGTAVMEKLIAAARAKQVNYIDLTSRPERKEANEFYKKLGFEKRNTNVYRLQLTTNN